MHLKLIKCAKNKFKKRKKYLKKMWNQKYYKTQ